MTTKIIAGVDEVGRGPLAGPVCAAAVILNPNDIPAGLTDSKKLTEKKREKLFDDINQVAVASGIAYASVTEIDDINILQASLLAMQRAVAQLQVSPTEIWIDGIHAPRLDCPTFTMIEGDKHMAQISAASILAKVSRDRLMKELDQTHPGYGFAQHKGYGTKQHMDALKRLGATPIHRQSFAPVKKVILAGVS